MEQKDVQNVEEKTTEKVDTQTTEEKEVKTFTQEEVNTMIQDRLAKEKKKMPSQEELKTYNDWKESQKTGAEKQQEQIEKYNAIEKENASLKQINPVAMYGHFEKEVGIIKENEKNYITFEEFKRFISVIDEPLWYTYFNFLFYADTRKGEAMALHWSDVDFINRKITIKATLQVDIAGGVFETTTKTNKNRIIMMNDVLYNILLNYKSEQLKYKDFKESWYVFGGSTPISKTTSDRKRIEYFNLSGVKPITNHQFRHSLTTILIQEYIKNQQLNNVKIDKYAFLSALANRNGHTVETMMKYYANLFPDTEQSQVIDLLNNLK